MPDPTRLCVFVAAKSDPGRDPDKQVNEDAHGAAAIDGTFVAVVCDGMGGHASGQLASQAAVSTILKALAAASPNMPSRERLREAIGQASLHVHRLGGNIPVHQRPGATCVAISLHEDSAELAHVGDSRCYRWRQGQLEAMTRDHSVIELWIQAGQVPREQAHLHPDAHRITRALGIEPKVEVELRTIEKLVVGDRYLLCSDGLTDLVAETDLAVMLGRAVGLTQLAGDLVDLANQRGGHDNITALLLEVADSGCTDPGGAGPCFELTAPCVASATTEQFPMPPGRTDRTLPLGTVDRTVIMNEQVERTQNQAPALAVGKTQPLRQLDASRLEHRGADDHGGLPETGPAPPTLRLGLLLGIALILAGLAVLIGLFRHH